MATNDVEIYRGSSLDQRIRYATLIADARGLLPDGVHSPAHALLIFEQAAALGVPPITGLSQIHIIKGKPTMSAGLMSGLIRKAGHTLRVWVEGKVEDKTLVAKAALIRSDDPSFTFEVEFSLKDAERAGLYPGKSDSNWTKWPRSMVKARVVSEIAREAATDVFLGSIYTPEELDPSVQVDEQGEMVAAVVGTTPPVTNLSAETTESSDIKATEVPAEIAQQWFEAADALKEYAAIQKFYLDAKQRGMLHVTLESDPDLTLEQYIITLGKAAAQAEGVPPKGQPKANQQTGEVVEDGEIVDAEVVEDDEPQDEGPAAVLDPAVSPPEPAKKAPVRSRARKPAEDAGAPA